MMDVTNRIVKICRRIEEIEKILSSNTCCDNERESMSHELYALELELEKLQPATQ